MSAFEKKTLTFSFHSSLLSSRRSRYSATGQPNYPGEEKLTQCLTSATDDIIYIYLHNWEKAKMWGSDITRWHGTNNSLSKTPTPSRAIHRVRTDWECHSRLTGCSAGWSQDSKHKTTPRSLFQSSSAYYTFIQPTWQMWYVLLYFCSINRIYFLE